MVLTPQEQGIIQTEVDWIRPYVESLFDFCTLCDPATEKPILRIFATPERPYAMEIQRLMRDGVLEKAGQLPLPATALTFLDVTPDPTRYNRGTFRKMQYSTDNRQIFQMRWPQPYNLVFQFDIRARWQDGPVELWSLMQQFQSRFDHAAAYIPVDMGPLGSQLTRMEMEGPQNTSEFEPGDNKERTLRRTYTLTVMGWLMIPPIKVPSARKFSIDEQDPDSGETFTTQIIADE